MKDQTMKGGKSEMEKTMKKIGILAVLGMFVFGMVPLGIAQENSFGSFSNSGSGSSDSSGSSNSDSSGSSGDSSSGSSSGNSGSGSSKSGSGSGSSGSGSNSGSLTFDDDDETKTDDLSSGIFGSGDSDDDFDSGSSGYSDDDDSDDLFEELEKFVPNYLRGDVNSDGVVDVSDMAMLIIYINSKVKPELNMDNADYNIDGNVNWFDVVGLANYLFMDPGILGDVNGDGNIDVADSIMLFAYLRGEQVIVNLANSDFNLDNEIDREDPLEILEYLFGLDEENGLDDELEDARRHKPDNDSFSFPVIAIYGYGLELKFVLYEKRSARNEPQIEVTDKFYSGRIGIMNGVDYRVRGSDLTSLKLYDSSGRGSVEDFTVDPMKERLGTADFDFDDQTVSLNFNSGDTEIYKIEEIRREPVKVTDREVIDKDDDDNSDRRNRKLDSDDDNLDFGKKVRNLFKDKEDDGASAIDSDTSGREVRNTFWIRFRDRIRNFFRSR
jgi:hypothetical protein